ncbi:Protein of unknown function [Cotesia congregata]|uniref:Uncharacterized protein n=1 Tax=Cotesia congregata TaxID=51543 RepID=A0A8J2HIJ3_COTCN|nr:Protein of unknown function [Cotesia congregata]
MVVLTRQKWFLKPFAVDMRRTWKASKTVSSLSRIIANTIRPQIKKRRVLLEAVYSEARAKINKKTLHEWQDHWTSEETGRWTARLIPNINVWLSREQEDTDFFLTQLLTGHRQFNA